MGALLPVHTVVPRDVAVLHRAELAEVGPQLHVGGGRRELRHEDLRGRGRHRAAGRRCGLYSAYLGLVAPSRTILVRSALI